MNTCTWLSASVVLLVAAPLAVPIAVVLESILNAERLVCSGERVIFTCITRGSPILEWFSEEYIGTGGDRLQILSGSERNTSSITPDVVAVRINVTNDNGITVIISELRIIASIKYPRATVSCSNGDQRLKQNITFRIFAVTLNSTLNDERVAHPQDIIIFMCTTRGSPILEWFSEEYIGTGGDRLQILSGSDRNTSSINPDVVATRISVSTENGISVIVSELRVIASIRYPIATVSCSNGSPKMNNITFQTIEMIGITESTTRVTMSTSTIGLPTNDDVNDTELAQLSNGAISGIAIAAAAVVVLMIASILAILLIIKICRPLHGSVAHGCDQENVDENVDTEQDLLDKLQGSINQGKASTELQPPEHREKSKLYTSMVDRGSANISPRNKRVEQVKSTASRLSWDSGHPSQKCGE